MSALALAFSETAASSVEVLVEGTSFYPPMLDDIAAASSSIHINQFGFRPGVVGDVFADRMPSPRSFEKRFSAPAVALSEPGRRLTGLQERAKAGALAAISPLL